MLKRIFLFLLVNILVVSSVSIILNLFNVTPYLTHQGIDYKSLLIFCFLWGSVGSLVSLWTSKWVAKRAFGVKVIDSNTLDPVERKLLFMVYNATKKAGLNKMPQVGYYQSDEINAFATGATKNSSIVAVSSGLVDNMNEDQVEAVIGHEIGHIANGDMVTMALLQGVVNSFVMFLSRVVAYGIAQVGSKRESFRYIIYFAVQIVLEIFLMILGSLVVSYFSRKREYRADEYSAKIVGREKMISALQSLQSNFRPIDNHPSYKTMQISAKDSWLGLFATHPKIQNRINALRKKSI